MDTPRRPSTLGISRDFAACVWWYLYLVATVVGLGPDDKDVNFDKREWLGLRPNRTGQHVHSSWERNSPRAPPGGRGHRGKQRTWHLEEHGRICPWEASETALRTSEPASCRGFICTSWQRPAPFAARLMGSPCPSPHRRRRTHVPAGRGAPDHARPRSAPSRERCLYSGTFPREGRRHRLPGAVTFPVPLWFSTLQGLWQSGWSPPLLNQLVGLFLASCRCVHPSIHPFKQQSWSTSSAPRVPGALGALRMQQEKPRSPPLWTLPSRGGGSGQICK